MTPHRCAELLALLLAALLPVSAVALPEDAEKEILSDFSDIEMFPNDGVTVFKGATDKPTCINQGTMRICGNEIRLEQADDSSLKKVTATGSPVRFQQQLKAGQELAHLSGATLVFDNVGQLLTVDGGAEFSQGGNKLNDQHIEYNLESGRIAANGSGQGSMTLLPPPKSD